MPETPESPSPGSLEFEGGDSARWPLAELRDLAPGDWQGSAALGILLALVVLAAFPVFLLSWLSRPVIKAQLAGWLR